MDRVTPGKIFWSITSMILFFLFRYLFMPAATFGSLGTITFYALFISIFLSLIASYTDCDEDGWFNAGKVILACACIYITFLIIVWISSWATFRWSQYHAQLGKVDECQYVDEITPMDLTQVPYIDEEYAKILGQKVLGQDPALGSKVDIGDFAMQQVDGKLVLVAPLVHKDIFKYMKNEEGTPGYIIVSATNAEDVKLVTQIDGQPIHLRYQERASFSDNLTRHIRKAGYKSELLTCYTLELDDNYRPMWVITTYKNTICFGSPEATGTIIVDPQTGDINKYSIEDTPAWADVIQPKKFISAQLTRWGRFVNGAWNLSNEGKLKPTNGMDTVYNNGDCFYYTGITSYGTDDSTNGFVLINTRTKEVKKYNLSGAHENAAQASAEGEVQNLGYKAGFPLPVNIDGVPTYFLPLKDKTGYVKKFCFVNIEHAQFVGVGDTITEAKRAYLTKVNSNGNSVAFTDEAYVKEIEGTILRVSFTLVDGATVYMFTIEEDETNIYEMSINVSEEIVLTQAGDVVKISYVDDGNGNVSITKFENNNVHQKKSEEQIQVDEYTEQVREDQNQIKQIEVNPEEDQKLWESLTDEERAKLLDSIK